MNSKIFAALLVLTLTPRLGFSGPGKPFANLIDRIEGLAEEATLFDERVTLLEDAVFTRGCAPDEPTRFIDNGDGTICDNQTGLIWEKKDSPDGVEDLSNPHDVDNVYSWTVVSGILDIPFNDLTDPDGTVFTDFLARLNNTVASNPDDLPFAGHTDWRIPTIAELRTIVTGEAADCSPPCWFPEFVPTKSLPYWSDTTWADSPVTAFVISIEFGLIDQYPKTNAQPVRAVRGPFLVRSE